jgi:hypothetical protein
MIAQNAARVLQKIHNLYLVVIGQMVFADGRTFCTLSVALRLPRYRW